jgi:protoporphyrinogen oxidase
MSRNLFKIIVRNSQTAEMSEITYELMISTLPLIELNNLCGGLFADIKLKHSTVILVGIALKKPQNAIAQQLSWAYYPRNSISFYRCTILSNFSTCLTPDSNTYWSVLCEIGRKPDSERESKDELVFKVIQGRTN